MKFALSITPKMQSIMHQVEMDGRQATSSAMASAANSLKMAWRADIIGAGLGAGLARSVRSQVYPKDHASLKAAAIVWSNSGKILSAFEKGVTITAKNGLWLAIPLPAAGKSVRGGRISPIEWEKRNGIRLRFVYRRGKPSLLVADNARVSKAGKAKASRSKTGRGVQTVPVFVLVPKVTLRKRLNMMNLADTVASGLASAIAKRWRD